VQIDLANRSANRSSTSGQTRQSKSKRFSEPLSQATLRPGTSSADSELPDSYLRPHCLSTEPSPRCVAKAVRVDVLEKDPSHNDQSRPSSTGSTSGTSTFAAIETAGSTRPLSTAHGGTFDWDPFRLEDLIRRRSLPDTSVDGGSRSRSSLRLVCPEAIVREKIALLHSVRCAGNRA
jgi:hypothetical protein